MPPPDDGPEDGPDGTMEELTIRAVVNGTTFMAAYVVEGGAVLLASADFGNAWARLDEQAPEAVAARLLRDLAEEAMARSGEHFMRDDEVNAPETPGA